MVIPRDGFFYPFLTLIMDSFVLLTTIYLFIYFQINLPEVPERQDAISNYNVT